MPPEPAGGLVIVIEHEVHIELLMSACEEVMARGVDEPTRDEVLTEAETLLREYGEQWPALTGDERFTRWAREEVWYLFEEELEEGDIRLGR